MSAYSDHVTEIHSSVMCTCAMPCVTRALHRLRVGEQQAVETMRVLVSVLDGIAGRIGDRR